jgi:hypothetical protein
VGDELRTQLDRCTLRGGRAARLYRAIGRWKNYERLLEPAQKILEPFVREFGYCP